MDVAESNAKALEDLKARCHAARIKPSALCDRAGVAYSTYWRAVKEPAKATVDTLGKLERAIAAVEREAVEGQAA